MSFILSQVSGGIALVLVCIGYFLKKKSMFLLLQVVANLFYATSFILVNSYVGGIIIIVSSIRCIYIYICEKHNFKYTNYFISIFICFYIGIGIAFWKNWFDIIPIITATLFTIAFLIKNLQLMRYVLLIPNAIILVYGLYCKTYTNAILDLLEIIIILVAIVRYYILKKKEGNIEEEKKEEIL